VAISTRLILLPYGFEVRSVFLQSAIRNPQSAIRNPQSAIRNPQSAIRNPQSAIRNPHVHVRKLPDIIGLSW